MDLSTVWHAARKPAWLIALLAIVAVPAMTLAGTRTPWNVFVARFGSSGHARGSMGSARNSANDVERIGCYLRTGIDSPVSGDCFAIMESGTQGTCWFRDAPNLAQAVASIQADSFVAFTWDETGRCVWLTIGKASDHEPKR